MKASLVILAVIAVGACTKSSTSPYLRVSFSVVFERGEPATIEPPPTVISSSADAVRISGYFETPCSRDEIRARAERRPDGIHVRISSHQRNTTCAMRPDVYLYEGRIVDLEPGTHRIRVTHHGDARRSDGVVADAVVTVP